MRLLLSFALVFAALLPAQDAATFRVGTWNIEFLGAPGSTGRDMPPRTPDEVASIGKKIAALGVAVLAVQEINDEGALRAVAAGAGASWDVLLGTSGDWNDGKTAQRIGFVFDRSQVELLHAEELLGLPREFEGQPIFHRVPVTACFRHKASGCDFRLVTVHLKASRGAVNDQKRRGEAMALSAWLDTLQTTAREDQDVILLGDFNCTYGTEPQTLFEQSAQRRYLPQPAPQPTIMHFPEPIDQIVVALGCAEVRADSYAVDNDFDGMAKETWRQTYSDHFPVTVSLVAAGDDDPDATFTRGDPTHLLPTSRRPVAGAWPFVAGARVQVVTPKSAYQGVLLLPVPQDGHGFVTLATDTGTVAIACGQVQAMHLQN